MKEGEHVLEVKSSMGVGSFRGSRARNGGEERERREEGWHERWLLRVFEFFSSGMKAWLAFFSPEEAVKVGTETRVRRQSRERSGLEGEDWDLN